MPAKSYENILLIADPIEAEKYLAQSLLSKNGSYLVIDPDGILEGQTSEKLKQEGYHVYICNVDDTKGFFYDYFRYYYYDIFHDEKTVLYLTGSDKIRNEKLIAEITLILDDILLDIWLEESTFLINSPGSKVHRYQPFFVRNPCYPFRQSITTRCLQMRY